MLNLDFLLNIQDWIHHVLCMIFQEYLEYFSLYSIKWPIFIAWLSLPLAILDDMCILIICCPVCDVINFESNHSFLIKALFYMTKKSWQKFKCLNNKKSLATFKRFFIYLTNFRRMWVHWWRVTFHYKKNVLNLSFLFTIMSCRTFLRITNIPCEEKEICKKVSKKVWKLINEEAEVYIPEVTIDRPHHVGPKKNKN